MLNIELKKLSLSNVYIYLDPVCLNNNLYKQVIIEIIYQNKNMTKLNKIKQKWNIIKYNKIRWNKIK